MQSERPMATGDFDELVGLSTAEALFRGLLEAAPDAMVVIQKGDTIAFVNAQLVRLFGYARADLLGQSIDLLVPERLRRAHVVHRERYFAEPRPRPMGAGLALFGRRKDGSEFPIEISLSPLRTPEGLLVMAAIRDTTERELADARLRASLREKEVLLKEIHHRVKNNLQIVSSMLNLQMQQLEDPTAIQLFKESQTRVRSIALFHEKLYQSKDLARIDIVGYLKGLAHGLFSTYGVGGTEIRLSVDGDDQPLAVDDAVACGLIVNELVSNAIKHAFTNGMPGHVWVWLHREREEVVLEVGDDGVGFPGGVNFQNPSTLGLRLVSILVEQIHGTITLAQGRGARFIVRFPGSGS